MTTPTDGEWMSAKAALEYLLSRGMSHYDVKRTIFDRPHEGLIEARAKRVTVGGERFNDEEVPPELWADDLTEKWEAGDFATAYDLTPSIKAFGVEFRRSDVQRLKPAIAASPTAPLSPTQRGVGRTVFIGHGHSEEWRKLYMFLQKDHDLGVIEFNSSSPAGISTTDHLRDMLDQADFAFLILTGEDEQATGEFNPRLNVVHEAGLFQGKLGFRNENKQGDDCKDA
jgi:CAP12/Pycsar effector protein, TIR domain